MLRGVLLFVAPAIIALSSPISFAAPQASPRIPGLRLSASPYIVDVGRDVTFTLSAKSWPPDTSVTLSFVSRHHGFSGRMVWIGACHCFKVAVQLAKRIHPFESARGTARAQVRGHTYTAHTTFKIRGLAPNGRTFAPGGRKILSTWVSEPNPSLSDKEHFCAWVHTLDGLGIRGVSVRFQVHYPSKTVSWTADKTNAFGLVCSYMPITHATAGKIVTVKAFAGNLRAQTSFTPTP